MAAQRRGLVAGRRDMRDLLQAHAIDRDEITQRDADFIIEAIKSAHRAGDYGEQELAQLEELAQRADDLKTSYDAARDERNQAVRAAIRAGATVADVAAAGHLSKTGVRKLMEQ